MSWQAVEGSFRDPSGFVYTRDGTLYRQVNAGFRQHFEGRRGDLTGTAVDTRTFEDAEPNYRRGFTAAHDERYRGRSFEEVEPDLRRQHHSTGDDNAWERLREEIREGFDRARR